MEGDVLLVACGSKVSVRNLRSGLEDRAADRAMKRYGSVSLSNIMDYLMIELC